MKKTISIKLNISKEHHNALLDTQRSFAQACNEVIPFAIENRCWNRVALHHLCYFKVRDIVTDIGSQMTCNAIKNVCQSYKTLKIKKSQDVPKISFKKNGSVHYDKRTYSIIGNTLSLFSTSGRVKTSFDICDFHREYIEKGVFKEAELINKNKIWFFNIVIELEDATPRDGTKIIAVDVGENNIATTSNGTIHGGGELRHKRDKFLNRRKKLQSNGSKSAKQCLKRISGKEKQHVKEVNHIVSKKIVREAVENDCSIIVLENLKNIRKRIKGNRRTRSRLHRWAWYELQQFIEYKAREKGFTVKYINPAYSSQVCSKCGSLGSRHKHLFKCLNCESYQHSDRNAAVNLLKLGESVVSPMASINTPMVTAI